MHKHKRYRYGPPLFRPRRGRHFGGMFWLIILAFMVFGGRGNWWPGILIVIGLAVLFSSFFRDERPPEPPPHEAPPSFDAPPFDQLRTTLRAAPRPAPPPASPIRRMDLLPATCPNCGGPVHSGEVKWTSDYSAACSYCGSNLQAKKQ